jgi:hypothetical protein
MKKFLFIKKELMMKFEIKYQDAKFDDRYEFENSFVTKAPKLNKCSLCESFTKWIDVIFQVPVCSEECNSYMWTHYRNEQVSKGLIKNFDDHFDKIKSDLKLGDSTEDEWKDIIIVVRDQLPYFKDCIESIQSTTKKYHLYIWDNASKQDTADYINQLVAKYNKEENPDWAITTVHCEKNVGFIYPNNEMAALCKNPYLILLNSDTKVFKNWDKTMIGFLKQNPEVAQVGYFGGHLHADGRGFGGANGWDVDYIPGWCFCISRETYDDFGLFDDKMKFAYFEDSDFSLRLKKVGKKIYALHAPLVIHYQNKTIVDVHKEGELNLQANFDYNCDHFKEKWKDYLSCQRVTDTTKS